MTICDLRFAIDELDVQILRRIRFRVPLVRRPWDVVAGELGSSPAVVISRVFALRESGMVRRIGGVFDAAALGYSQALVAFSVGAESLDSAGLAVAAHPGVSHCYSRDGSEYNLWFTLAVSPDSTLGLESTAGLLADRFAASHLVLPVLRRFKLAMHFDFDGASAVEPGESAGRRPIAPTADQRRAIAALQEDLPGGEEPFAALADSFFAPGEPAGGDELLVHASDLLAVGAMRRYAAVVDHRSAGLAENVMVVWRAGDERAELAAAEAGRCQAVSHCFLRRACDGWPYDLYTMIHGRDRNQCLLAVKQIAAATGLKDRRELWTTKEYKKAPVKFFTRDEADWKSRRP